MHLFQNMWFPRSIYEALRGAMWPLCEIKESSCGGYGEIYEGVAWRVCRPWDAHDLWGVYGAVKIIFYNCTYVAITE